jgi:hypothetical protein
MTYGHLDAAMLAEYDEGSLAPPQVVRIEEHLTRCLSCSGTLLRLKEVRAQVSTAPTEIPVPPAVAARIDGAVAAEQARRRGAAHRPAATIHPFRRRFPRVLAAAAAVAAVGFGGYVLSISGGSDSGDSATSAEGADLPALGHDEAGAEVGQESPTAGPGVVPQPQRSALDQEIRAVVAAGTAESTDGDLGLTEDCGRALARELGRALIGAAPTELGQPGAVLVVVEVDGTDQAQGFVLPACDAGAGDALTELTVPVD